ncbi:hypothetical protein IF1G_02801 [Cordyceps javanica]|uniref:Uncharacterized protein n=1 Tax=Cordyceps javanica TaxID=43265 RepID=A0A545W7M5_9HYPO|nr:hypothetical protein IF1G_02801 [Cordyceps javanica]TQW09932.1 hypothetical protein IF2G_02722 [Cordyceps javanica]
MDDLKTLLLNARDRLGCSGLRNLSDLAQMRLETLEKRIAGAQHQLTVRNTLSIYAAWLWKKAFCIVPKDLYLIIEKWCVYLWGIGCTREMARVAWTQAQTMLGPMTAAQIGSLHMKIGSAITNQFPTVSLTKRKHAVLEDTVGPDKQPVVEETNHQNVHLPPTKKHKASHIAKGVSASPFCQPVPIFPQSVPISKRDFLSLSPSNQDPNSHSLQDAGGRVKEESKAPRRRERLLLDIES